MRVIEQLIEYFRDRGYFDLQELLYLEERGFECGLPKSRMKGIWNEDGGIYEVENDEYYYDELWWEDGSQTAAKVEKIEAEERGTKRRGRRSRSNVASRDKSVIVKRLRDENAARLSRKIAESMPKWEETLEAMVEVAELLSSGATYRDMPVVIRNTPVEKITEVLTHCFKLRQPKFNKLWEGLLFEGELDATEQNFDKKTLKELDTLMWLPFKTKSIAAQQLRFKWLLRHEEICWAYNLMRAQSNVLQACADIYRRRQAVLMNALRRDFHPVALMTFTLLHNAEAFEQDNVLRQAIRADECYSRRRIPSSEGFQAAYKIAMEINPEVVRPFFLSYAYQSSELYDKHFNTYYELDLTCPVEWNL